MPCLLLSLPRLASSWLCLASSCLSFVSSWLCLAFSSALPSIMPCPLLSLARLASSWFCLDCCLWVYFWWSTDTSWSTSSTFIIYINFLRKSTKISLATTGAATGWWFSMHLMQMNCGKNPAGISIRAGIGAPRALPRAWAERERPLHRDHYTAVTYRYGWLNLNLILLKAYIRHFEELVWSSSWMYNGSL